MIQKEFVLKTSMVCSNDGKRCYAIDREFVGMDGNTAILLTIYPSYSANESFRLDSTAYHFLGHMQELGLRKVVTVNLFSKVVSGSKLSCRNLSVDEDNLQFLQTLVNMPEYKGVPVIVAYGSSMKTSKAAQESKKKILDLFEQNKHPLYQLVCDNAGAKNGAALHPLFLGVRCQNMHWYLEPFDISSLDNDEEEQVEPKKKGRKKIGG